MTTLFPLRRAIPSNASNRAKLKTPTFSLHQIAPYIGRLRVPLARELIESLTKSGDLVVDPFVGAGTIALEAAASGRRIISCDWNPYAFVLTHAKLFHPSSFEDAEGQFDRLWRRSRRLLKAQDLRRIPLWVRNFFHNETLRSALAFRDACIETNDNFMLSCLLSILHHERPGFLSYPSSHLVPYLRTRKYPRSRFHQLYQPRDVKVRMLAKLRRTLDSMPSHLADSRKVTLQDARTLRLRSDVQAVITSPPYMNELDYIRDNRLRLWFIDKCIPQSLECGAFGHENAFSELLNAVFTRLARSIRQGGYIALVLGDVTRGARRIDAARVAVSSFAQRSELRPFSLVLKRTDRIPDVRRSRQECKGTKKETLLIFQRRNR